MKHLKIGFNIVRGFGIILGCYLAGKYLSGLINNFLSGAVIGMLILFFLLIVGIVKKSHVQIVAEFLLANLILFFIPALIDIMLLDFNPILPELWHIVLIAIVSTVAVMGITGLFVQWRELKGGGKV